MNEETTMENSEETLESLTDSELLSAVDEIVSKGEDLEKSASKEEVEETETEDLEKSSKEEVTEDEATDEVEDLEKGNVSTPADHGKPVDGPGPGETTDEVAMRKKKKMKEKDLGHTDGKADGKIDPEGTTGQGQTKEHRPKENKTSYYKSLSEEKVEKLLKSIDMVAEKFSSLEERLAKIESAEKAPTEEEMRKSISVDITERLAKSFFSESEELKKSVRAALQENEEMRKSIDEYRSSNEELKKSNEELQKSLKAPANTRQAITNLEVIEKSEEQKHQKMFKSKTEILDALEELRKSGKITGDDVISYNVSNFLSDKTKKLLKSMA